MCVCVCVRVCVGVGACVHCIISVLAFKQGLFYYQKEQNTPVNTTKACREGGGLTKE